MIYNVHSLYVTDCNSSVRVLFANGEKKYNNYLNCDSKKQVLPKSTPRFDDDGVLLFSEENNRRSLRRARVAVVDLATCNKFDYFGTITIDPSMHDATNYALCIKKVKKAFDNYKQNYENDFVYILVPELGGQTNRLHFHFLIANCNYGIAKNEHGFLDWFYIREKFGFVQITAIGNTSQDRERVAKYCAKYITKNNIKIGNRRYFRSCGLKQPKKYYYGDDYAEHFREYLETYGIVAYSSFFRGECYAIPKVIYVDFINFMKVHMSLIMRKIRPFGHIDRIQFIRRLKENVQLSIKM